MPADIKKIHLHGNYCIFVNLFTSVCFAMITVLYVLLKDILPPVYTMFTAAIFQATVDETW